MLGSYARKADDPRFRDLVPFHEYFHGETGAGLGAMHQTGWTGLVALLLQPRQRRHGAMLPVAAAAAQPADTNGASAAR